MTALRTSFADLLKPGFREIFQNEFKQFPPEWTKICNQRTSTRQYEEDSSVSGFGAVPEKNESVGITYDDPIQGYDKKYTHTTYALGFRVSREMYEDDLYGKMRKMPLALARSLRITREQDVANIYNNAFASGTGGDGQYLCVTTHPLLGGGTEQNCLSSAADCNTTSFEQALIDIAATVDDRGLQQQLMPKLLLGAPSNAWTFAKILGSAQDPDSGNNAINPGNKILPGGYEINHYLTDSDAWFILCEGHEVNVFTRRADEFDKDNDFDTEDAKFKASARWSSGFSEWRGVFGSPGV